MSMRQIRKLQRESKKEESEEELCQKITLPNNLPKYSFNLLIESDNSSESSSPEEDSEEKKEKKPIKQKTKPITKEEESNDSEWDKLLEEAREPEPRTDSTPPSNQDHFLSCPMSYFKTKDSLDECGSKYTKRSVFKSSARHWICPGLCTREFMQLRLLASKQFEFSVQSDPDSGREKFVLGLSDFYLEIDDICSSAVHSQDFELFRRLMETHPFHIGILIRASCINTISLKLKPQSNHQEAFGHLYLAVKIMQAALPHRFSIYRTNLLDLPNVWLPSSEGENLVIYRLLVLYMISLERKGQWQTSLAVCKLLMAMDFPQDVSHSILHVDLYLLNCFGDPRSISNFVYNYYNLVNRSLPPVFWFLPNFAITLPLQLFLHQNKTVPVLLDKHLEKIREYLLDLLCLEDNEDGFSFKPRLSVDEHLALFDFLGEYAPYLFLLRSLIQYPLFLVKMAERTGSSPELRSCSFEEPFKSSREMENEDYDLIDYQLVRCYTYKCGDLWSGNNGTFLSQTASLLLKLYSDDEDRLLIESFHALWSAYVMEVELPEDLKTISVTEFDLGNYSLPVGLEFPI